MGSGGERFVEHVGEHGTSCEFTNSLQNSPLVTRG